MQQRMKASERRDEVIAAAVIEFAEAGYSATSTAAIARRVGVSQPYLFQLFGTKQELFLAAVRECFIQTRASFEASAATACAAGKDPAGILAEMGDGYVRLLLADRKLLRLQLHAYTACGDPEIQAVVRDEFYALWQAVANVSGMPPEALLPWFANGMLINVFASFGNPRTIEEFYALIPGVGARPS
jgi:AcrR family transcriptional regulator